MPIQASQRRRQAAQLRAAKQRTQRVGQALQQFAEIEPRKKKPPPKKDTETEAARPKRTEPRASSTDPQARVMKMADGGFHPAYNVQFVTTTDSQVIAGVEVCNSSSDLALALLNGEVDKLTQGGRAGPGGRRDGPALVS